MSNRKSNCLGLWGEENPLLAFDQTLPEPWDYLVGVDEAGRGALAGPVVAGAVLVRKSFYRKVAVHPVLPFIGDSKQLSPEQRETALAGMEELAGAGDIFFAHAEGSVAEIAAVNIIGATRLAMVRAVAEALGKGGVSKDAFFFTEEEALLFMARQGDGPCVRLLVDGLPLREFLYPHTAIVKGDGCSLIIAMASIVAKVNRDGMMRALAEDYPAFGFARHKGYGTEEHRLALGRHGPCVIHRMGFLKKIMGDSLSS